MIRVAILDTKPPGRITSPVKEKLHWRNIPIPDAHVVGLVVGILLQLLLPMRLFPYAWIGHATGWPLALTGVALALWAAMEAGESDMSSPDRLLSSGPHGTQQRFTVCSTCHSMLQFPLVQQGVLCIPGVCPVSAVSLPRSAR